MISDFKTVKVNKNSVSLGSKDYSVAESDCGKRKGEFCESKKALTK